MIAFVADENFRAAIVHGLQRRDPAMDLVRVQDVGLRTAGDPEILEWAASEGRVLLTHDQSTIPPLAWDRVGAGLPMSGVLVVPRGLRDAEAIEEILLVAVASTPEEREDRVDHLPL